MAQLNDSSLTNTNGQVSSSNRYSQLYLERYSSPNRTKEKQTMEPSKASKRFTSECLLPLYLSDLRIRTLNIR